MNNDILFLPGSISSVSPIKVRNSSDLYSRISRSGEVLGFGSVYYDSDQFISIVCAHDLERNANFDVIERKNTNGKRIGYEILIKCIGVTLYATWQGKIMIGSFKPLLDYIQKTSVNDQQRPHYDFFVSTVVTNSAKGAKASNNLKTMAKAERAVNSVRKIQYRLGYMSDEHAAVAIKSGFYANLPISASDFKYATAVAGPDIAMLKGKGVIDRRMDYEDLVPQLKDGEFLIEIDLGYIGHHCFLIGITLPFNYGVTIYLGNQKGVKTKETLYRAILELQRIIAEYGYRIKFLVYDSERSLARDSVPLNVFSVQDKLFDEFGIICQQLPSGVHAKRVERRIGVWKGKIRSCVFRLVYCIPQSWIPHLGIASMIWCNLDPTDANVNMAPPLYLMRGETIDAKKMCVASFGEIVLSPVDNGLSHNSTAKERRSECIYLYPKTVRGSHKLLVLDSIDGPRVVTIFRDVKTTEVLPYTPISIISRINRVAKTQMSNKSINSLPSTDIEELRELTGFRDESIVDVPIDLLRRDSSTISMDEATAAYIDDDSWSDKMSYTMTQQRECSFLIEEMGADNTQFSFAVKKELAYAKAMKSLNSVEVEDSMKKEFTGLVRKWHPVKFSDIPKVERKNILPGQGLVREKSTGMKGRFVGGGHRQDISQYDIYREVSSPTASLSSFFAVAAHAAAKGLAVGSFDVKQAYLKAPMPRDGRKIRVRLNKIYVDIIKSINEELNDEYTSFQSDNGSVIVELDYALYGTLEAGRIWYNYFKNILVSKMGYKVSAHDDCVFNMFDSNGIIISTIVIHVDDGFVTGSSEKTLDDFFDKLTAELGELTIRRGRVHEYLGMLLNFSQPNVVHITIEKMIKQLISDWNVSKMRNSPARSDLFAIDESSEALSEDSSKQLHRAIAQLLYLATHVRPDVLCATIFLTSRVQKLTQQDLSKFMDILFYLNYTIALGIMLGGNSNNHIGLYAYADASFGVHYDGKSHGGTFISYGRGPILTRSNKLKEVSKSSSESELMQLSDTTSLAARERDFAIEQQHIDIKEQGILLEDNKSAIHMANNGKSISNRTRHIKVRYFFVKQYLDNGEFRLEHCPTKDMIADILTKPLQGELFLELRDLLLGYEALSR